MKIIGTGNMTKRILSGRGKIFFPAVLSLLLTAAPLSTEASAVAQKRLGIEKGEDARTLGRKLIRKIDLNYPNVHGEVEEYLNRYPESPVKDLVNFKYALYNFNNEDYAAAGAAFAAADPRSLTSAQKDEYLFKKGYCHLRSGENGEASQIFRDITGGKYHSAALYYLGYIKYVEQDFAGAIPLFEAAGNDKGFAQACRYHILESKFMLKDYRYVTENGPQMLQELGEEYKSQGARILSESFYALNRPQEAGHYFEIYSTTAGNITSKDKFYAGMIAYTLKQYRNAADLFQQVTVQEDSIGQSAWYHLGQCYIQLKNKHNAQEAFKMASATGFDKSIQEDALFNHAKLTFDLYRNIAPFEGYLAKYPASNAKWDEIHNYMATAFLMEHKFEQAIDALKKIRTPNKGTLRNLQKASFLRGLQLAESSSYSGAAPFFRSAASYTTHTGNTALGHLANFWLAECLYRKGEFQESLQILEKLSGNTQFRKSAEYPVAIYNAGYNHFKMGNFPAAIESFATYLAMPQTRQKYAHEARLRLADSYFMNRNWQQAAELYGTIAQLESYSNLYAPLQGAVAYGLLSEDARKIEELKKITAPENSSKPLYTQALYELGRTYVQNGKDSEALHTLSQLINNPPDSLFWHKALLEAGMISANRGNQDEALAYYRQIVEGNGMDEEIQNALAGMENIYRQQNRAEEYLAYLDKIGLSETKSASERETMLFNSAEQVFLSGNYTAAINSLQSFLEKFPEGAKAAQAIFYIAESYNKLGKAEAAADAYMKVMMEGTEDAFREIATLNYGKLSYQLQRYDEAARAFETLEHIAQLGNNRLEGTIGKMRSLYNLQDFHTALAVCNGLLSSTALQDGKISAPLQREIEYIKAKCLLGNEERDGANDILERLAKDPSDSYGAEAACLLIMDAYDAGEFEKVEERTFALSDSQTSQTYWLAKSFIALGDSYAERDNFEQAKATFESIRDNYTPAGPEDDIPGQVEMRLNKLMEQDSANR